MKLGINGWRMVGAHTGVGRYVYNIVRQWTPTQINNRFSNVTLYTHKPLDSKKKPLPHNIKQHIIPPAWRMLVWENLRLGPRVKDDVVYHPSFSIPLWRRGRSVVVLHEIVHELYPHLFPRSVQLFYRYLYRWSAKKATLIICGAEASKQDIAHHLDIPLDKIRVIHMAPAGFFREPIQATAVETNRNTYVGHQTPYFLFVGKLSGRRSIPLLLEGFAAFKKQTHLPHKLVVVGFNIHNLDISRMLAELNITDDVIYPGYVSDDVLRLLYKGAIALISPTLYEPISLPVMEAQAVGTAVIATDSGGMRETTGGHAHLIKEPTVNKMASAMTELAQNPTLRDDLVQKGLAYSQQFSWQRTAQLTLDVLEEAAHR